MTSAILTAVVLVLLSAFLIYTDAKKWRELCRSDIDSNRMSFGRRQFRRRLCSSSLIGLAGFACLLSPWMLEPRQNQFGWYWSGLLLIVVVLGLIACADVWDSFRYFRSVQKQLLLRRQEVLSVSQEASPRSQDST